METNQHLFKELELAEKLFSDGSIKNAQKKIRNVLKETKLLSKIPNKLKHKINAAINKSRYFDEISSFAVNPKRDKLINAIENLIKNPLDNPKKHAHSINDIQTQWQLLDLSSKPASKSQWLNFNNLTNKAWEPCKEYFNEIKEIKLNNALERKKIILKINQFVSENTNKWPETKKLILFLQNTFKEWQRYAPVLDNDLDELKKLYFEAKKPINNEIKKQEMLNREKKELLITKVNEISSDDNDHCLSEFSKLKKEWLAIGTAGKKYEKKLWKDFNSCADRFFVEKKKKLNDEIELIKNLNKKLKNDEISISEVNEKLKETNITKNTNEFKKIKDDIRLKIESLNNIKIKDKHSSYLKIYDVLLGKKAIEDAPSIFIDSITRSFNNKKTNLDNLSYACVKLEILAGIDTLKKDQNIRSSIQLELLSNKFNNNSSTPNDLDSLINYFILNFSKNDSKAGNAKIWNRIVKCIDKLIS